jgi:hypothetical protein
MMYFPSYNSPPSGEGACGMRPALVAIPKASMMQGLPRSRWLAEAVRVVGAGQEFTCV